MMMPRPQVLPRCVTVVVLMSNIQVKAPALEAGPGPGAHGHHHYDDACWGSGPQAGTGSRGPGLILIIKLPVDSGPGFGRCTASVLSYY
jgi:hypothetical protein